MKKVKPIYWICLLSLIASVFYNELNLSFIPESYLRDGEMVKTNDDLSYLRPVENFVETGVWKDKVAGDISYFLRSPGYGIFYWISILISPSNPLFILKIIQLLFFTISVYCLFYASNFFIKNRRVSYLLTLIYGVSPFAIGFLYYSLTEGITPAFMIIYLFFLVKGKQVEDIRNKNKWFLIAALWFAFLFILRPALGVFGMLLLVFVFFSYLKQRVLKIILFGCIAASFMLVWQIRNYLIADKIVGLHPIYYPDNTNIYRPTLSAFWDFFKTWGDEGQDFHACSVPFWNSIIEEGDTTDKPVNELVDKLPEKYVEFFGRERLFNVFKDYQQAIINQKPYFENRVPMPAIVPIEQKAVKEFVALREEFIDEYPLQYYIIAPLKVFKVMAFHSNLSLFVFQSTFRGNWLMETTRLIFFSLHTLSFCVIALLFIFYRKKWSIEYGLILSLFIYCFYLFYVQRGIEERYTLPILPLALIVLFARYNRLKELANRLINRS